MTKTIVGKKIFEKTENFIDFETGELKISKRIFTKKVSRDKFIKIYFGDIKGILNLTSQTEFKVLYKLWEIAIWGTNEILLYKEVKEEIAKEVEKSASGVSNAVASLVKKGLLKRVSRMKYILNPQLFFKGEEIEKSNVIEVYLRYEIDEELPNDEERETNNI